MEVDAKKQNRPQLVKIIFIHIFEEVVSFSQRPVHELTILRFLLKLLSFSILTLSSRLVVWLFGFYGISTFEGLLMLNPLLCK